MPDHVEVDQEVRANRAVELEDVLQQDRVQRKVAEQAERNLQ